MLLFFISMALFVAMVIERGVVDTSNSAYNEHQQVWACRHLHFMMLYIFFLPPPPLPYSRWTGCTCNIFISTEQCRLEEEAYSINQPVGQM